MVLALIVVLEGRFGLIWGSWPSPLSNIMFTKAFLPTYTCNL